MTYLMIAYWVVAGVYFACTVDTEETRPNGVFVAVSAGFFGGIFLPVRILSRAWRAVFFIT